MKKYNVEITNQAHESLDAIIDHKISYSDDLVSAYNFLSGFYEQVETHGRASLQICLPRD